jgi:hypothetical protein
MLLCQSAQPLRRTSVTLAPGSLQAATSTLPAASAGPAFALCANSTYRLTVDFGVGLRRYALVTVNTGKHLSASATLPQLDRQVQARLSSLAAVTNE